MAEGLDVIRKLKDPVGTVMGSWRRPNGMRIERVRVPLGVIGVIYESRPNVTADAGALCLKSGNAAVLRGGSDSFHSSGAIHACLIAGLRAVGLPEAAISRAPFASREAVGEMLDGLGGALDVIVPRGGKSLVARVEAGQSRASPEQVDLADVAREVSSELNGLSELRSISLLLEAHSRAVVCGSRGDLRRAKHRQRLSAGLRFAVAGKLAAVSVFVALIALLM